MVMPELGLRPGDVLDALPKATGWELRRAGSAVARVTPPTSAAAAVRVGEHTLLIAGSFFPLDLALVDQADGRGIAWLRGQRLRRAALVQVTGAAEDLQLRRPLLGGARLDGEDGTVGTFQTKGRKSAVRLHLGLAKRHDVPTFAGGVLLSIAWLLLEELVGWPASDTWSAIGV